MQDASSGSAERKTPERLIVGQIVAPFGVQGEMKVNILTEFPERFSKLKRVVLAPFDSVEPGLAPTAALDPKTIRDDPGERSSLPPGVKPPTGPREPTEYPVEKTRIHKNQLLLKLQGVDSVEDTRALRGYWVQVPVELAKRLPRDAYYIFQVVGIDVYTADGELLGKVADVITTTANDVYVVRGSGIREPGGELLIPAIKTIVQEIDVEQGKIVVRPLLEWM